MDSRTQRASGTAVDPRVDPRIDPRVEPRIALATWLRAGRTQRKLSLEDVAKVTKIQPRILEKLESGQLDGLPADVFVKGFVRSFAKCVGLPESEAMERYSSAQSGQATAVAKALVETMNPTVRLVGPKTLTSEPVVEQVAASDVEIEAPVADSASVQVVEVVPVAADVESVEIVHVAALAPISAAPDVAAAPVAPVEVVDVAELAPISAVPVARGAATPVVEIAAALAASLEPRETATKKKRTRKKSTTAAPKAAAESTNAATSVASASTDAATSVASASTETATSAASASMDAASVANASTDAAAASTTTVAPKAPRSRKKKTTVMPVVASAAVAAASTSVLAEATSVVDALDAANAANAEAAAPAAPATLSADVAISTTASGTQLDTVAEPLLETTPFVRVDATSDAAVAAAVDLTETADHTDLAELHEAASFAMSLTSEYELEVSADDSTAEDLHLAAGSQRISASAIEVEDRTAGTWQPTMPAMASTPSAPWRRPQLPTQNAYVVPSLVIDDADPDSADREREVRASKDHSRLSFLPPILLDREDRSARQGGLTLAVIILLIAATLTLSYLMRRPSPSGDGVTLLDGQTQLYS